MVRFAAGAQIFVCISMSGRALEPFVTSHPIGTLNKSLTLSTANIKYEWSYVSTLPNACKLLFIKKYGDNFLPDIRFVYVKQTSLSFNTCIHSLNKPTRVHTAVTVTITADSPYSCYCYYYSRLSIQLLLLLLQQTLHTAVTVTADSPYSCYCY